MKRLCQSHNKLISPFALSKAFEHGIDPRYILSLQVRVLCAQFIRYIYSSSRYYTFHKIFFEIYRFLFFKQFQHFNSPKVEFNQEGLTEAWGDYFDKYISILGLSEQDSSAVDSTPTSENNLVAKERLLSLTVSQDIFQPFGEAVRINRPQLFHYCLHSSLFQAPTDRSGKKKQSQKGSRRERERRERNAGRSLPSPGGRYNAGRTRQSIGTSHTIALVSRLFHVNKLPCLCLQTIRCRLPRRLRNLTPPVRMAWAWP